MNFYSNIFGKTYKSYTWWLWKWRGLKSTHWPKTCGVCLTHLR